MARPERTTVDYFPFLCKEGKAMYFIDKKYGNDGYATWVKVLREIAVTSNHHLILSKNVDMMYMASRCNISTELLENILTDLSNLGEINMELWTTAKVVWSDKFIEHIQDAYKKRNNKCITLPSLRILLTSLSILLPSKSNSQVPNNTQSKVKNTKVKNTKEDEGFEAFWNVYDKKTDKVSCEKKFFNLTENEKDLIMNHITKYVLSTPDKQYRKNPETYLKNKCWNDEIIKPIIKPSNTGRISGGQNDGFVS